MLKILLVDDVQLLIEIQKRFLSYSHIEILTANDGVAALEIARREIPDLIVMDKYMPNMDGMTCCRELKKDPATAHIPIIMATNAVSEDDRHEYLNAGCVDVLAKPLECKQYLNVIRKYVPAIERRHVRIPRNLPMQYQYQEKTYDAVSENISLNGLFALSSTLAPVGSEVKFVLLLPGCSVPMEIKARVVWHRGGSAPGFGVEFIEITGQGISMLRVSELKAFIEASGKK